MAESQSKQLFGVTRILPQSAIPLLNNSGCDSLDQFRTPYAVNPGWSCTGSRFFKEALCCQRKQAKSVFFYLSKLDRRRYTPLCTSRSTKASDLSPYSLFNLSSPLKPARRTRLGLTNSVVTEFLCFSFFFLVTRLALLTNYIRQTVIKFQL